MPEMAQRDSWHYRFGSSAKLSQELQIQIRERAPYTTTIEVLQFAQLHQQMPALALKVQVYHDVEMAEVVAWSRHRPRQGRYEYPNKNMYHADEKAQLNRFLSDWLSQCLAQGHILDNPCFTGSGQAL